MQKYLIAKIAKLNGKSTRNLNRLNRKFLQLTTQCLFLCRTIKAYSQFCSPINSTLFPYFISTQCYILNVNLYIPSTPFVIKHLLYIAFVELNLFLAIFTLQCAQIVKNNKVLEQENTKFYRKLFVQTNSYKFKPKTMIKV